MDMDAFAVILLATGASALLSHALPRTRSAPSMTLMAVAVGCVSLWIVIDAVSGGRMALADCTILIVSAAACAIAFEVSRRREAYEAPIHDRDLDGIVRAASARDDAQRALARFEAARSDMPMGRRVADSFVVSEDERIRDRAEAVLDSCTRQLEASIPAWVENRTRAGISADPHEAERYRHALAAHEPYRIAAEAATRLHLLAAQAESDLVQAIHDLGSAGTMETIDAFSSNKGIAVMSSMQNETASRSVARAQASIEALQVETKQVGTSLMGVDDTFDMILDLALDGVFDFMSFVNIGRISDARDQCEAALIRITAERERLGSLSEQSAAAAKPTLEAVDEVTMPHLMDAVGKLPHAVREMAPARLPVPANGPQDSGGGS